MSFIKFLGTAGARFVVTKQLRASGGLWLSAGKTNLSIDPKLIDEALALSGERSKKAAVTRALEEFIARRRQKRLLELMGKLEWDPGYDCKAERSR